MFFLEKQLPTSTWCSVSGSLFECGFTTQRKQSQHVQSSNVMRLWSCASAKHRLQNNACHVPGSTSSIPMPILQVRLFEATMHNVALSDGSVASVTIFDVKETLLSFLNDPGWMGVENFTANYDPFTGKSTIIKTPLDEIHTGTIWDAACRKYCGNDPHAFSLALVCYYNKRTQIYMGR